MPMMPMEAEKTPSDSKLKRTNLMKRRESQALLEGVRKNRTLSPPGPPGAGGANR